MPVPANKFYCDGCQHEMTWKQEFAGRRIKCKHCGQAMVIPARPASAAPAPPPEAERIWANLTACKHLLLDAIKPGASSRAIYELYLGKVSELGLPPISFIGHGIGLHLHEDPYLGPTEDQLLEDGMVLGIEPLVYETGFGFGMQNKDMVLVTSGGCELLSDYTDTERLIIVP